MDWSPGEVQFDSLTMLSFFGSWGLSEGVVVVVVGAFPVGCLFVVFDSPFPKFQDLPTFGSITSHHLRQIK